ncbi:MAG: hypothetical protein ACOC2H_09930 [Spirochaetota bacterium]
MRHTRYLFILAMIIMTGCGSMPEAPSRGDNTIELPEDTRPQDKYSSINYEAENPDRYSVYLVDLDHYTTNGRYYHEKHEQYLLGIAEILIQKYGYRLKDGSIGFYYDKVENKKNKLYLGLDVVCDQAKLRNGEGYYESGRRMINVYLPSVLDTVRRYEEILSENEVEGTVIGLLWYRVGQGEFINIWLPKQNINEYFNDQLTFNELILKATITDKNGKKIRLTL